MILHKNRFASFLPPLLVILACGAAQAQGVYRSVGPDGRVTFSDRPPVDASARPSALKPPQGPAGASDNSTLPYELRQIAARFPVTLYTASDCAPCNTARNMLVSRGVPFTERTVSTNEDIDALQRLSGGTGLPFGIIGGQALAGFSEMEWTQYLDAAGYPKQSQLPGNYRRPAPTPLVAIKAAEPASSTAPQREQRAPAAPPAVNDGPTPSNPAGIRF